jgi:hypothetical protein
LVGVWQTMTITIRGLGFPHSLEIPGAAKIVDIKLELERLMIDLTPERTDLTYNGQLLKDELTVQDYRITHGVTLLAFKKTLIWIKIDPIHLYSLTVRDHVKVGELKEILHAEFGVDVEDKILQFPQGRNLDDRCYLSAYGIYDESELYLI